MRLIDADNLKLGICKECTLYPDKCLNENCDRDSIYHIGIEPTVEAIPIEWIEKWLEKTEKLAERQYYYYDLSVYETYEACICRMLEDWRKRK